MDYAASGTQTTTGTGGVYRTAQANHVIYHGKTLGIQTKFDGMGTNIVYAGGSGTGYVNNAFNAEELTVETGGGSAESNTSTATFDMVPKEGGNTFSGLIYGHYSGSGLQGSNLTDSLRARGLTTSSQVDYLYDSAGTLGGPISQDKLWFFTSHRVSGSKVFQSNIFYNSTQGTPFYTPDRSRPGFSNDLFRANSLRLTWQVSPRNKINVFGDNQKLCACRTLSPGVITAAEAVQQIHFLPLGLYQAAWVSPVTNRFLLEAGTSYTEENANFGLQPEVRATDIAIRDARTGILYNAGTAQLIEARKTVQRFSASYITGSHAFKAGVLLEQGMGRNTRNIGDINYTFNGGVPSQLTQLTVPSFVRNNQNADLGFFVQDQWTTGRATLNLGLRFDYLNQSVPPQSAPAGRWAPARSFEAVKDVPEYMDLQPRLGVAYDLFGDGRTALKASLGRFNGAATINQLLIANGNNPMVTSVNTVNRTWADSNSNFVPDCDLANFQANGECGQISDLNFGRLNPRATRYDEQILRGWGVRDHTWDFSTEVQHQIGAGISVTGAYYRNWFGNFTVTDNTLVTPADFTPYCVTAPTTAANGLTLPGGGGYQICGLADVSLAQFGRVENLVTRADDYGKQTQVSNFVSLTTNARMGSSLQFGGGIDAGRTVIDRCFTVDSPQELLNCRTVTGLRGTTQIKLFASYMLPGEVVVSTIFQNMPGQEILATYTASNAEIAPSLGRNLAACGTRTPCTATATVPLIAPATEYEARRTSLDLRVGKSLRLGARMRLQANLDVYNVLNRSDILRVNTAFGPNWRQPIVIMDPRLVQIGGQLTF